MEQDITDAQTVCVELRAQQESAQCDDEMSDDATMPEEQTRAVCAVV